MSKRIFCILCICAFAIQGIAQGLSRRGTNTPELELVSFYILKNEYDYSCIIRNLSASSANRDRHLVFFISSGRDNIRPMKVSVGNRQQDAYPIREDYSLRVQLVPTGYFRRSGFNIYPVLLEGDLNEVGNTLNLVAGEFSRIEDILTVLMKAGQKPLAYAEIER
jgi:hypothetical protein